MRIKTGETATVGIKVDLEYKCSSCGEENLFSQTITGTARTPTVMGINIDNDFEENAQNDLMQKLSEITNDNNPSRFNRAYFDCQCRKCGHREPWAKMNYTILDKVFPKCLGVAVGAGIILLCAGNWDTFNIIHLIFLGICILGGCICIGIKTYKTNHSRKMERLITELPSASIPQISPHSAERHAVFNRTIRVNSTMSAVTGQWICKDCGTANSINYSQCKKCGKYKQ